MDELVKRISEKTGISEDKLGEAAAKVGNIFGGS